ncbi:drug/metabolite transporter (DMT)-like permease [Nocardiopsis arvandica]|uniref:Drug/metabolite transporter (DMT)-like permease n=1 Tax=Nocardiopsis sinuspersici TaxID=501010 RepID=A0A7Z0BIS1_9ACTN|nr:DMT family transporter [Nocardiopsis sinuspersici]NYH50702.1 drug/metabolite transporter (DMT)-like permease [Nocardiopsis sinuspersici]
MRAKNSATVTDRVAVRDGGLWAALGVLAFSLTFPATLWSLDGFGPWTSTALRCSLAGLVAAGCLYAARVPRPAPALVPALLVVASGCVVAFPLFTAMALRTTSAGNAAVVVGALPLATAAYSSVRTGTRHSPLFWAAAVTGAAAVIAFTLARTGGALGVGDLYLFAALAGAAAGYAEGGRLASGVPGWQVISWALVLSLPLTLPLSAVALALEPVHVTPAALTGLAYLALVSQFGGFVAWYRGMGLIGVVRASQLQLAQPLLTLAWAALLLGEHLSPAAPPTAAVVLVCVVVTQRARRTGL